MRKRKLKPTEVSSQKSLKPSSVVNTNVGHFGNKSKQFKNILKNPIIDLENSENKLLDDRDYTDLEI